MLVNCNQCKKEIKRSPSQIKNHNFCDKKCEGLFYAKRNPYTEKENHIEIEVNSKKYGNHIVLVDKKDFNLVKNHTWRLTPKGYLVNKQNVRLHRLITNCPKGLTVDHINKNKLDNRNINLRICTNAENQQNKSKETSNKSKCKNVYYEKARNTWRVRICVDGQHINLGSFPNTDIGFEMACETSDRARQNYHPFYV